MTRTGPVRLARSANSQSRRHLRGDLDAGQACAHDDNRETSRGLRPAGQRLQVCVEPNRSVICVDVERMLRHPWDVGPNELAAEGEYESVVRKGLLIFSVRHVDKLPAQVDAGDPAFHTQNTDRAEHVVERYADRCQVGLVVADADAVKGVAIDEGHLDRLRSVAELIELASRADGAPESGKSATENEDLSGTHDVSIVSSATSPTAGPGFHIDCGGLLLE